MKRTVQTAVTPSEVLDFWFAPDNSERWFNSTDAFDAEIRRRFERTALILADPMATTGIDWRAERSSHLAEIIVLDQFPRNMYRGSAKAFQWDGLALSSAQQLVESGGDMDVSEDRRSFAYMPFMHAEDLVAQNRCVELISTRLDATDTLKHAIAHRKLIEKFGRFPHRNDVLGRQSTEEEKRFLNDGGYDPS